MAYSSEVVMRVRLLVLAAGLVAVATTCGEVSADACTSYPMPFTSYTDALVYDCAPPS
jgi:hypothetical protein